MKEAGKVDSLSAALLLDISHGALRQLVHRKRLVKIGKYKRRNLYLLSDVLRLAQKK